MNEPDNQAEYSIVPTVNQNRRFPNGSANAEPDYQANSPRKSIPSWFYLILVLFAVPIITILISFLSLQVADRIAEQRIEQTYADLGSTPQHAWERKVRSRMNQYASRKHTETFGQLVALAEIVGRESPAVKRIPLLANDVDIPKLGGNAEWPDESITVGFLESVQPLFLLADHFVESAQPVWTPVIGYDYSNYQGISNLLNIQALEVYYALFQQDTTQAWTGLQRMQGIVKASNQQEIFGSNFVSPHYRTYQATILRSLQSEFWDQTQVQELKASLPLMPTDLPWSDELIKIQSLAFLMSLEQTTRGYHPRLSIYNLIGTSRNKERVINLFDLSINRWNSLPNSISNRPIDMLKTTEIERFGLDREELSQIFDRHLLGTYQTAWRVSDYDLLRFTQTALAIKEFQLKYGQWPSELLELTKLGLSKKDWSTLSDHSFGYRHQDESALLWRYNIDFGFQVSLAASKQPPPADPPAPSSSNIFERVEIR